MKNLLPFLFLILISSSCGSGPKTELDLAKEAVFNNLDNTFQEEQKRRFKVAVLLHIALWIRIPD